MKFISKRKALVGAAMLVAAASLAPNAFANGDEFFGAEEIPGHTEFVYFGSVKDEAGNYLDAVEVTLHVAEPPLTYVAYTDIIGRFRTLDVGRAIVDLGYEVDTRNFQVHVARDGYKQVRMMNRAPLRAKKGAFEINFVMAKDAEGAKKDAKAMPAGPQTGIKK